MPDDNYIVVGKVLTTHGIKGWLTIKSFTKNLEDIFSYKLYININFNYKDIKVMEYNITPKKTMIKVQSVSNIEEAEPYIGVDILALKNELPKTDKEEYYWYDLIGLNVFNADNIILGVVDNLFSSGDNDILIVKNKTIKNEIFIPFIKNNIIKVEKDRIIVRWKNEL